MIELSTQFYSQSIKGCMDFAIGESGIKHTSLDNNVRSLSPALKNMQLAYEDKSLPLLRVPEDNADLVEASVALDALSKDATTIIFFGTGGSGLGGRMLAQYSSAYSLAEDSSRNGHPEVRFCDNLDGRTLDAMFKDLDLAKTRFVIISKSGGTPETLVQGLTALQLVIDTGLEK